jgi:hypothetical protein
MPLHARDRQAAAILRSRASAHVRTWTVTAIAYSILASCDLAGVNPREYLTDVLPRLARDGVKILDAATMTPAAWAAARRANPVQAAGA